VRVCLNDFVPVLQALDHFLADQQAGQHVRGDLHPRANYPAAQVDVMVRPPSQPLGTQERKGTEF
jgi:hypothetical protein